MTPRRILLVSPGWPRAAFANGIVSYVDNLRKGIAAHGSEARIAAFARGPGGDDAELIRGAFSRTSAAARLAVRACWKLSPRVAEPLVPALDAIMAFRRVRRAWHFDLAEIEESHGLARWLARATPAPVVVRLHGPWFLNGPAAGVREDDAFARRVHREGIAIARAEALSSPSNDVLERVRRRYGLRLSEAVVIPNPGPDPNPEHFWRRDRAEAGLIVFVGRFDRHKGGDVVIDAFCALAERRRGLRLVFAGRDDGVVDDAGKRWSLSEYVAARVAPQHRGAIDLLGQVPPEKLIELRKQASVVVFASRYENFPLTLLEALAQGSPLVSSDAGACTEIVEHDRNALVFPAGDANALASRLETLLDHPERAAALAAQGLADYRARFLPDQIARRTLEFYEEVLARRSRSAGRKS